MWTLHSLKEARELEGLVWALPSGAKWIGPIEILGIVGDHMESSKKKIGTHHLVVAAFLEVCVLDVIKVARICQTGKATQRSFRLKTRTT